LRARLRRGAVRKDDQAVQGEDEALSTVEALKRENERLAAELEQARAEIARLEALAHVDEASGALNRRGFRRELERALSHAERYGDGFALIMADLDGLKRVNDRFGHPTGDAVIRAATDAIRAQIRGSDVLARLGGDEFAILLWRADESHAREKARAIQVALSMLMGVSEDVRLLIGLSVGVAVRDRDDTADALYARADADLYFDKSRRGRLSR
jgi:diguanylate cyclase (GGDEF)-like protein